MHVRQISCTWIYLSFSLLTSVRSYSNNSSQILGQYICFFKLWFDTVAFDFLKISVSLCSAIWVEKNVAFRFINIFA